MTTLLSSLFVTTLALEMSLYESKDDLTITGVVDMEWVYAGPAQQFGSAPWWLLMDRPLKEEWDFDEDDAPEATDRYFKYLEIFIRMLSDEEGKMTGNGRKELTELVNGLRILEPCGSICFCRVTFLIHLPFLVCDCENSRVLSGGTSA